MDATNKPAGSTLLKVTGILMIIGGAISVILAIFALVGLGATLSLFEGQGLTALIVISVLFTCIAAALELIAGIIGVQNCDKPEKAQLCFIFGIIVLAIAVIARVIDFLYGTTSIWSSLISLALGVVLPILYILGALRNKKSTQA